MSETVPVTSPVKSPTTSPVKSPINVPLTSLLKSQVSVAETYKIVAAAPSTVKPAPLAAAADAAPFATVMLISSTSNVAVLTVVVVPLIVKSPSTTRSLNVTLSVVATA